MLSDMWVLKLSQTTCHGAVGEAEANRSFLNATNSSSVRVSPIVPRTVPLATFVFHRNVSLTPANPMSALAGLAAKEIGNHGREADRPTTSITHCSSAGSSPDSVPEQWQGALETSMRQQRTRKPAESSGRRMLRRTPPHHMKQVNARTSNALIVRAAAS